MRTLPVLRFASLAGLAMVLPRLLWPGQRLLWQGTASMPQGLYWQRPLTEVRRGMLVVAELPAAGDAVAVARGYLAAGHPVIKPVAAVPGDTVCQRDGVSVRVAAGTTVQETLGLVQASDRLGRLLPQWAGCQTLTHAVFLLSPQPQSFDSRYVGSVPLNALRGEAIALWTSP